MIGILITTFLRDESLFQCVNSILTNWNDNYYPLIIDQGVPSKTKEDFFYNLPVEYQQVDYDIGPLKARNLAIKRFQELKINYFLMFADSLMFTKNYDFAPIINFLKSDDTILLCGFDVENRIPWEGDMTIKDKRFYLDVPKKNPILFESLFFQEVDICRNCFLGKTNLFLENPYDEDRHMADHETAFYRWKQKRLRFFYLKDIQFKYNPIQTVEYTKARKRFNQNLKVALDKYNLGGWIKYSPEQVKIFDAFHKRRLTS